MLQQAALSQAAAVNSIVGDVLKDEFLEQLCKLMLVVAQEQVDKAAGSSHAPAANGPAAAAASAAQDGVEGAAADPQQQQEAAAAAAAAGAAADAGQQMDMDGQQQQPSEPGSAAAAGASSSTPAAAVGAGGLSAEEAHAGAEAAVLQELHLVLEKINATIGRKVGVGAVSKVHGPRCIGLGCWCACAHADLALHIGHTRRRAASIWQPQPITLCVKNNGVVSQCSQHLLLL
jgi:hypothetical protein